MVPLCGSLPVFPLFGLLLPGLRLGFLGVMSWKGPGHSGFSDGLSRDFHDGVVVVDLVFGVKSGSSVGSIVVVDVVTGCSEDGIEVEQGP